MTKEPSSKSKEFAKLFSLKKVEIVPWIDENVTGLSIIKDYPDKISFVPARNKNGLNDTVVLIKIGYKEPGNEKTPLIVSIHKTSRYLMNDHWNYDFNDESSPTENSLKESKESKQPIDLEETSRYQFDTTSRKIRDTSTDKYVRANEVVDYIYKEHLKTLNNFPFRIKMSFQKNGIEIIGPINEKLEALNFFLFGRKIKETKDLGDGYFRTYSHDNLVSLATEKTKILGSDFPISNQSARTFSLLTTLLYLLNYYFSWDLLGFVKLVNSTQNSLFLATITFSLLSFFDRTLPHLILFTENCFIRLRILLIKTRIHT